MRIGLIARARKFSPGRRRVLPTAVLFVAATATLGLPVTRAWAAQTAPAGYITLQVAGTHGSSASALSYLGLGLTRLKQFRGKIKAAGADVIIDNAAPWADPEFSARSGNYYLELTSGDGAGLTSQVTAAHPGTRGLTLADDLSPYALPGVTFVIRPNWTLATVFGERDEAGLGGGSAATADRVLVYDSATRQYTTYYYQTTPAVAGAGVGWRSTADASVDVSKVPFSPHGGILIERHQPGDLQIPLLGAVKTGVTDLPVNAGLNILNIVYPGKSFTLGNSGLFTGSAATGLRGGSAGTADQVLIYNPAAGTYCSYYYKTAAGPAGSGTGWRSTGDVDADASATPLPAGSSVLINRVKTRPFEWVAPPPF